MTAKNRALRAVEFLQKAPNKTLTSYELMKLLPTNHASRAIDEAEKDYGYKFKRGWKRVAGDFIRVYTLVENEKLISERKPEYQFDPIRQVFVMG